MNPTVLVVEDDATLCGLLTWNLKVEGYEVRSTPNGQEALLMVREQLPDVIILDWTIEEVLGIEVCRQIRMDESTAQLPIIMLTARGEEKDMIRGLKTGADDYVIKPFSVRELLARIDALLRRTRPSLVGAVLQWGDIELDATSHRVRRGGETLHLGSTEFRLLHYFMENPNRVISRQQILDGVWGYGSQVDEGSVKVHIRSLRKAINRPGDADPIRTIRHAGYAMDQT